MALEKNRNIRMTVNLSNALDTVATGKGMTASQVVRLALSQYIRTATEELKLSNVRRPAVELSNAVQGDVGAVNGAKVNDSDLVQAWSRTYDR
jgi:antitoxin component of RelBE/YafQ-DinJ toxin-antitoxin module